MKNCTEKELKGESYFVNYDYDDVAARYDAKKKKYYIKSYGKEEYEAKKTQYNWIYDITTRGKEISQKEYDAL
jgi:hypothetical protein